MISNNFNCKRTFMATKWE